MERTDRRELTSDAYVPLVERATVAITASAMGKMAGESLGTGFFITPEIVATCAHVVARSVDELPPTVKAVAVASQQTFTFATSPDLYFRSPGGMDLALLQVSPEAGVKRAEYVLLSSVISVGDEVRV